MNEPTQSIHAALLPFLGVLRIHCEDAAKFLEGQVTHDTRLLADGRTLLAACNNPQGRVNALGRVVHVRMGAHFTCSTPQDGARVTDLANS